MLVRQVHDTPHQYFSDWNLFHVFQSGFTRKHSCQTALTKMIDTWLSVINDYKIIRLMSLDFRKAFDLVNNEVLLKKLQTYGLGSCSLKWFSSYLPTVIKRFLLGHLCQVHRTAMLRYLKGQFLDCYCFLLIFINDFFSGYRKQYRLLADDSTISLASHKL